MKESISIKALNNKINKLFEDAPKKDSQIIKEIRDLLNNYENSNDFIFRHQSTLALKDLSKKLEMYSRRDGIKDNQRIVNKLIDYIESKSDLRFWLETNKIGYKEYQSKQTCIKKSNYYTYENIFRPTYDACFDIVNSPKRKPGIVVIDHIDNKRDRSKFDAMPFDINGNLTEYIPNDISYEDIKAIGDKIIQVYNDNRDNTFNKGDSVKIFGRLGKVVDIDPDVVEVEFPADDQNEADHDRYRLSKQQVQKV